MADILTVTKREATGKRAMRKLREEKQTPGVYYEAGKESVPVSILTKEVDLAVRHGSRVVELAGDMTSSAMIKAIQWDAFGSTVLHVDLTPVSEGQ